MCYSRQDKICSLCEHTLPARRRAPVYKNIDSTSNTSIKNRPNILSASHTVVDNGTLAGPAE